MSSSEDKKQHEANNHHRKGKELASCKRSQVEANMRVGFPDELDQKSKESVETDQGPRHRSRV